MNDGRGLRPEVQQAILRKAGITDSQGYEWEPYGIHGCDARNAAYDFIEARHKDYPLSRCRKPMYGDPEGVGIVINVCEVQLLNHPSTKIPRTRPILFLVEVPTNEAIEKLKAEFKAGRTRPVTVEEYASWPLYRVVIDPLTADKRFHRGLGRGDQPVYFIPVDDFERIF